MLSASDTRLVMIAGGGVVLKHMIDMPHAGGNTRYEHALMAAERLLRQVGEDHWANWLQEDIALWRRSAEVSHHRSAYGGMGSFNDVVICRRNRHQVSAEQEPWVNCLFAWLKAILFHLSTNPTSTPDAAELRQAIGRHTPSLSAFVGGADAPDHMRGYAGASMKVAGARCRTCGHAELKPRDLDRAIADELVPELVFRACEQGTLTDLVDRVLRMDLPGLDQHRELLRNAAERSGIQVVEGEEWMWTCPACGSKDTAAYRWVYVDDEAPTFQPASDNLPMR